VPFRSSLVIDLAILQFSSLAHGVCGLEDLVRPKSSILVAVLGSSDGTLGKVVLNCSAF